MESKHGYWIMMTIMKIAMLILDITMFLFTLFLSLYSGDTIVDLSNSTSTFKLAVSIIFLIQCVDIFLDIIVSVRNVVRVFAVQQTKTKNLT